MLANKLISSAAITNSIPAMAGSVIMPIAGISAVSAISRGVPKAINKTIDNSGLAYSNAIHGYGKRGMNSNNLNTSGLVQGLHGSRRKMR